MTAFRRVILTLGLLAGAPGCATMGNTAHIEEAGVDSLHGTWRWMSNDPGGLGYTAVKGQLILNPDATYMLTEYEGSVRSTLGRFSVFRVTDQDSLDPWIELEHGGTREERVFQFSGRDTLLLRDGISGYAVTGSEVDLLVRAPLGRPPEGQPYDQEPVPITMVAPTYPVFARDAGITGKVVLHVLIGEDGRVQDINVVQSVVVLDGAAVDAVRKWVFKPALKNGVPVAAWLEVPLDFH